MAKFIVVALSDGIFEALRAAGVFSEDPANVARVVIDLKAGAPARAYVELFVDTKLIGVVLAGGLRLIEGDVL
jgi:hypothetical protein